MSEASFQNFIAVVIPTSGRPEQLFSRSLASIALQTRPPDLLVIVDDSPNQTRRKNQEIVTYWKKRLTCHVVYLENNNRAGASTAWNMAFRWLYQKHPEAWVALLDDDDAWLPSYLEGAIELAQVDNADIIVSGITRIESDYQIALQISETFFTHTDFLKGNPHWQGSNTFARLLVLLQAGGFDESFESTNDRDMALRLLDLPWLKWSFLRKHLVLHYADDQINRLSSKGSIRKTSGLKAFYRKYCGRMPQIINEAFFERALKFGVLSDEFKTPTFQISKFPTQPKITIPVLMIGVISSPEIKVTLGFLEAVKTMAEHSPNTTIEVIIFDNSVDKVTQLLSAIQTTTRENLSFQLLQGENTQLSIAEARTRVQLGCYRFLNGRRIPVWLLDDDVRFDVLTATENTVTRTSFNHLAWIEQLASSQADVIIGSVTGEPPLPFSSSLRVQMVDLVHNLEWFAGLFESIGLDAIYPSRHAENMELRQAFSDYYYDLSRLDQGHLERPFWFIVSPETTVLEAFLAMVAALLGIFQGQQIFRPLVYVPQAIFTMQPSFHRGPNTLILNPECLKSPNFSIRLVKNTARRSDFNWSLFGSYKHGWSIVSAAFPIRQDRTYAKPGLDYDKLVLDIQGHSVVLALAEKLLKKTIEAQPSTQELSFSTRDLEDLVSQAQKYLQERCLSLQLNHCRILALLRSIKEHYLVDKKYFWNHKDYLVVHQQLTDFIQAFTQQVSTFETTTIQISDEQLETYFSEVLNKFSEH